MTLMQVEYFRAECIGSGIVITIPDFFPFSSLRILSSALYAEVATERTRVHFTEM